MPPVKTLLLAGLLVLSGRAQAEQVKTLCLRPSDVPRGFVQSNCRLLTNRDVASMAAVPLRSITDFGRIGGYLTEYTLSPSGSLYYIGDDVSQFHSEQGAARWDAWRIRAIRASTWHRSPYKPVGIRIGDEASMWSASARNATHWFTEITIYFRRGSFAVGLTVDGHAGTFGPTDVVALALVIDRRLSQVAAHR